MNFGSLFAGIGGIDLGLERAGMVCKWQVEIDDFCLKVLEKHWPDVPRYGDVKEIETLPYVDLIAGGFPCQPVSVAGKRLAQEDERWLWPDFLRVIRMVRPRYVFVENVPGLLHAGMGDVLGGLASCGYDAEWQSIPAWAVGSPQRRDRVYIVAYTNGEGLEGCFRRAEPGCFQVDDISTLAEWSAWPNDIPQPVIGRGDDGFSTRVDRLRGLGNAVVPQVAEWIGRRILEHEALD